MSGTQYNDLFRTIPTSTHISFRNEFLTVQSDKPSISNLRNSVSLNFSKSNTFAGNKLNLDLLSGDVGN